MRYFEITEKLEADDCSTPLYDHDCEKCKFLGRTSYQGHNTVDVYLCGSKDRRKLIARYSDEPANYYCPMDLKTAEKIPAWSNALKLLRGNITEGNITEGNITEGKIYKVDYGLGVSQSKMENGSGNKNPESSPFVKNILSAIDDLDADNGYSPK